VSTADFPAGFAPHFAVGLRQGKLATVDREYRRFMSISRSSRADLLAAFRVVPERSSASAAMRRLVGLCSLRGSAFERL
jgi:hypothetical protein